MAAPDSRYVLSLKIIKLYRGSLLIKLWSRIHLPFDLLIFSTVNYKNPIPVMVKYVCVRYAITDTLDKGLKMMLTMISVLCETSRT